VAGLIGFNLLTAVGPASAATTWLVPRPPGDGAVTTTGRIDENDVSLLARYVLGVSASDRAGLLQLPGGAAVAAPASLREKEGHGWTATWLCTDTSRRHPVLSGSASSVHRCAERDADPRRAAQPTPPRSPNQYLSLVGMQAR